MCCFMLAAFLSVASYVSHYMPRSLPAYETVEGDWAEKTLSAMTLQEKIGQLFMVATTSSFEQQEEALASMLVKCPYKMDHEYIRSLIERYHIGGLIFLFKSTPEKQIVCMNNFQRLSKTPLLIGQDCEWGLNMRLYDTVRFPRNMTLGALPDKNLIYELGCEIGRQCKAIGVHIDFGPVVDVNNNRGNPVIHDRSFGENAEAVAQAGALMMKGLQEQGVMACAKHFPGHGDTTADSHVDLPLIAHDKERLHSVELVPFKKLIQQGVCAVMSAHVAIPALEPQKNCAATCSRAIVTDLLEKELGFRGLKITDGLGMEALTKHYAAGDIEYNAFVAGNDILLCPLDVPAAAAKIEEAIQSERISEADLNRRVLKILRAKQWVGCNEQRTINPEKALAQLRTTYAQKLKEKLYEQAVTIVRNTNMHVESKKGIALVQVGTDRAAQTFREHLDAAIHVYLKEGDDAQIKSAFTFLHEYEHVVVVVANMNKFVAKDFGVTRTTRDVLTTLRAAGKRITVVAFGTPYSAALFNEADNLVIAYEDDAEAQRAAADVVRGTRQATGALPVTV